MKTHRSLTWALAVTLAGVAGFVVVTLAPQTAEAVRTFRRADMVCVDKTVSPGLVVAGVANTLTYVVTVRNSGNRTANDVVVTDTLPPEIPATATFVSATPSQGTCDAPTGDPLTLTCDLGSLAAGAEATVTIVVDVTAAEGDRFRNFASVSTSSTESNTTNNGGAGSDCDVRVIVEVVGTPSLVCLSKTATPPTLDEGVSDDVLYRVTIQNNGTADATNVQVKDTLTVSKNVIFVSSNIGGNCGLTAGDSLPSGTVITCDIGTLAAGVMAIVDITVNVPTPGSGETFANSAVAMADGPISSNVCPVTVTVIAEGGGGEGCTPGGWRNNEGAWGPTGLNFLDLFDATFGFGFDTNPDLVLGETGPGEHDGSIWARGGGLKKVQRHGTACLLNALHPDVDYDLTAAQCIAIVLAGGSAGGFDINDVVDFNEQGCDVLSTP